MIVNVHNVKWKTTNNAHLLCDTRGVKVFSICGETAEFIFNIITQEIDGGQTDIWGLKALLDLCVTGREEDESRKQT